MAYPAGIRQWGPGTFSRERIGNRIGNRIGRGEAHLFVLGGRAAGTMALRWSDEETRGDVPDDAGYVHGLAIRRDGAGKGPGRELLRWAEARVAGAGRTYLRLDCGADNRALNDYYAGAGFRRRGLASVHGVEACLYEKPVDMLGAG